MGGLGVFTKTATKIYHWPGPGQMEKEGISPYYKLKEFPKNFSIHYPLFPSWDEFIDGIIEVSKSDIAILVDRIPIPMLAQALTASNDEGAELMKKLKEEANGRPGFVVILAGDTENEFEYKKKVLDTILSKMGAELLGYLEREDVKREYLWSEIRVTMALREVFRATGRFLGSIGDSALFQTSSRMMIDAMKIKEEYQKKGLFRADEGPDCMWGIPIETGHTGHAEQLVQVHPAGEAWGALMEFSGKCEDLAIEKRYGTPVTVWGDRAHDKWGPHLLNYHHWLRKIKKAYDPNAVSEPAMYISAKDEDE
jgi:hypothetical protein